MSGFPVVSEDISDDRLKEASEQMTLLPGFSLKKYIEIMETKCILTALHMAGRNKAKAAKILGMNRTTLVEKMRKRGWIHGKHERGKCTCPRCSDGNDGRDFSAAINGNTPESEDVQASPSTGC
jgi:hypothetical protein